MSTIANIRAGIAESRKARHMTCTRCGWTGEPDAKAKGSIGKEIMLWILFFPAGIIYSLWRIASKRAVCDDCGGDDFLPARTKAAQAIRARFES